MYFFLNHYLLQNVLGNYFAWMVFMTLKKKIKSLAKQSIELSAFKISFCLIWHLCLLPECTFQCRVTYLNATFFSFFFASKCHFHAEFKIAQNAWPLDFRKLINIFTFWKKIIQFYLKFLSFSFMKNVICVYNLRGRDSKCSMSCIRTKENMDVRPFAPSYCSSTM